MSSAVVVIAQLEAKPAFSTEFRAALTPLIAATVQEPGCHSYQLHQSQDNPHSWMLYEVWESQDALKAHQQQAHFIAFVANTEHWFASSTVRRYHAVSA
jgi:quinol monooxygenase YgiN